MPGPHRRRLVLLCFLSIFAGASLLAAAQPIRAGGSIRSSEMQFTTKNSSYDTPPRFLRGDAPIYPITQIYAHNSGAAEVAFTIGTDGRAHDIRVISATNPFFGSHTVLAMATWKFEPARHRGQPVAVTVHQTFHFTTPRKKD